MKIKLEGGTRHNIMIEVKEPITYLQYLTDDKKILEFYLWDTKIPVESLPFLFKFAGTLNTETFNPQPSKTLLGASFT